MYKYLWTTLNSYKYRIIQIHCIHCMHCSSRSITCTWNSYVRSCEGDIMVTSTCRGQPPGPSMVEPWTMLNHVESVKDKDLLWVRCYQRWHITIILMSYWYVILAILNRLRFTACSIVLSVVLGSWPIDAPTVLIRVFGSQGLETWDNMLGFRLAAQSAQGAQGAQGAQHELTRPEVNLQNTWNSSPAEKTNLTSAGNASEQSKCNFKTFQPFSKMFITPAQTLQHSIACQRSKAILRPCKVPERSILTWQELCQALRCQRETKAIAQTREKIRKDPDQKSCASPALFDLLSNLEGPKVGASWTETGTAWCLRRICKEKRQAGTTAPSLSSRNVM